MGERASGDDSLPSRIQSAMNPKSMARILAKLMIEIIVLYLGLGGGVIARQLLGATLAKFVNKKKQYTKP